MIFSRSASLSLLPVYLLPSIPFRRRKTSTDSTSSNESTISSEGASASPSDSYLQGHTSRLRCAKCAADICLTSQIISKGFTGRYGRAYLVSPSPKSTATSQTAREPESQSLPNTKTDAPSQRQLVTGAHTVSDVRCVFCGSILGWKYDGAEEESQRYKVGKYILETKMVCSSSHWEHEDMDLPPTSLHRSNLNCKWDGDIEFDSQDEDECEDLFAGVWSPGLAVKRRQNKSFRRAVVAELDSRQR